MKNTSVEWRNFTAVALHMWVAAQTWEHQGAQATRATPTRVPDSTAGFWRVLTGSGIAGGLKTSRDHVSSTVGSFGPQIYIGAIVFQEGIKGNQQ